MILDIDRVRQSLTYQYLGSTLLFDIVIVDVDRVPNEADIKKKEDQLRRQKEREEKERGTPTNLLTSKMPNFISILITNVFKVLNLSMRCQISLKFSVQCTRHYVVTMSLDSTLSGHDVVRFDTKWTQCR